MIAGFILWLTVWKPEPIVFLTAVMAISTIVYSFVTFQILKTSKEANKQVYDRFLKEQKEKDSIYASLWISIRNEIIWQRKILNNLKGNIEACEAKKLANETMPYTTLQGSYNLDELKSCKSKLKEFDRTREHSITVLSSYIYNAEIVDKHLDFTGANEYNPQFFTESEKNKIKKYFLDRANMISDLLNLCEIIIWDTEFQIKTYLSSEEILNRGIKFEKVNFKYGGIDA